MSVLTGLSAEALQWRVLLWPLLFGLGAYLLVTAPWQPIGRPKPNLRARLRRLDVDARIQDDLERRVAGRPLFANPLLERLLRPVVDDAGRLLGVVPRAAVLDALAAVPARREA